MDEPTRIYLEDEKAKKISKSKTVERAVQTHKTALEQGGLRPPSYAVILKLEWVHLGNPTEPKQSNPAKITRQETRDIIRPLKIKWVEMHARSELEVRAGHIPFAKLKKLLAKMSRNAAGGTFVEFRLAAFGKGIQVKTSLASPASPNPSGNRPRRLA